MTGHFEDGEWHTENPSVALVSSDGTVSPTRPGVARLIHRRDSEVDTIAVTVREAVDSVHLGADLLQVGLGRSTKLSMRAFDDGSVVPSTTELDAKWTSTAPGIVTVDTNGVVTAAGVGCAAIIVNVDTKVDTETVAVTPTPAGSDAGALPTCAPRMALRWTTALPSSIRVGETAQVGASSGDGSGAMPSSSGSVTYATSDDNVANVSSLGALRGVGAGDVVLTATSGGQSISADISVVSGSVPAIGRIIVVLSRKEIAVGDSAQGTAYPIALDGHPLMGVPVAWTVSPASASVASVDANGKVRGTSGGTADVVASLNGVSGTAQLVVSGTASTGGNTPATVNPTGASAVLSLMGPTINVSQTPGALAWYEANFKKWGDVQWNDFGPRWDAGNGNAGYDRAAINYVWWARTGDTTYYNRAHALAVAYRNGYLVPASFMTSPHWSQIEGLYLDWIVTGDTESRDAVIRMANVLRSAFDLYLDATYKDWLDNRIQARVLLSYWMAEKIEGNGSVWTSRINSAIPRILAIQNADGHWGFPSTCGGSWNFMTGMLGDVLSRMYNQRGDNGGNNPAILTAVTKAASYLWDTQWRPADQSFNYASLECLGAGGPTSASDLNGLILPMYGWLGKTTGDASWFTKGDAIMAGMTGADIELYKQFSEAYTSSYRYLGYRYGQ